jgi:CRISPR-associated protein Csb2
MTAIQIAFPWGRYYAHPWGLNPVRLREAEWPPSPWRLLRALASSWFRANPGVALSEDAVALIESLGRALPEIWIGKAAFGQTVHYQPNYGAADAAEKQAARYANKRHENHFVAVHGPVIFRWSGITLSQKLEMLLGRLLADISYFGRSESICQAELITAQALEKMPEVGCCRSTGGRRV